MVSNHNRWMSVVAGVLLGLVAAVAPTRQLSAAGAQAEPEDSAPTASGSAAFGTQRLLRLSENRLLTLSSSGTQLLLQTAGAFQRTRSWTLPDVRRDASLTIVPDGRVLVWGGHDAHGNLQRDGIWFDPDLKTVEPALRLPMTPRSGHSATVLTDGRVLFAGGLSDHPGYELWTPSSGGWMRVDGVLPGDGHRAVLRNDGKVHLFGGGGAIGARPDLLFDPRSDGVAERGTQQDAAIANGLAGSLPEQGSTNAAVRASLSLRFSEPVRLDDLNQANVTLFGPGGVTGIRVTSAEGGRLAFVHPSRELFPDAPYTLMVKGVSTQKGKRLALMTLDFRTAALPAPRVDVIPAQSRTSPTANLDTPLYCEGRTRKLQLCQAQAQMQDGVWTPGRDNAGENWRLPGRQPELAYLGFMPSLFKAWGKSALTGTVLRSDGVPVAGVAVSVGPIAGRTDAQGQFLLYDVPAGRQRVYVDGTTANRPGHEYGQFVVGVDVKAGVLTQVPFTMWLPRITARDKIQISSPTTREQVLTHPDLPGMELRIPAGTVIRDQKGKIVTEVAIVPTPVNRSPYPLPTNFSMYFTLQPGGAVLQGLTPEAGKGARVYYPNYDRHPEGTRADFWLYDAMEGWRVYGQGYVNKEETQFVPEQGVALHEVVTFGAAVSPDDPAPEEGMPPDPQECGECNAGTGANATAGDPIDLVTGRFTYSETDIEIPDVMPLVLGRNYRPSDSVKREFGLGTSAGFMYRLAMKNSYAQMQLVLPNGTPLVFHQTSGSGAYGTWRYSGKHGFSGATLASESAGGWKYRLTLRDGTQMTFEQYSPNRIKSIQDRHGSVIEYQYDAGRVSRMLSPSGRYIDLGYDNQNRITSAVDPLGSTWRYEYNAQGMLSKVSYPDNTFRRYEYKSYGKAPAQQHLLNAIFDQRGNRLLFNEYKENDQIGVGVTTSGQVIRQTLADGAIYTMEYGHFDGSTYGTLVTHPDGSQRRVTFDGSLYPATDTLAYATPLAQTYRFERDSEGRMTSRVDPLGRRTEYEFDAAGNDSRITALAGTAYAASASATYDGHGNLTSITAPLGRKWSFEYQQGCLSRIVNGLGNSSVFSCNAAGQMDSMSDALSHTSIIHYVGPDLAAVADPSGRVASFRHDAVGRPIAGERMDGEVARVEYDAVGRLVKTVAVDGSITEMAYDGNGNLTDVLLPHGAGITYEYDVRDRLTKRTDALGQVEAWTYDVMGRLASYADRRGVVTRYFYDLLGRVTRAVYADGGEVAAEYDAGNRRVRLSDSASGLTTWLYDGQDRVLSVSTPQGVISYTYDLAGRRTSMKAEAQPTVSYQFDAGDRLVSLSQAGETVQFHYDIANRLVSTVLPNGVRSSHVYSESGDVAGIAWGRDGEPALGSLGYGYDSVGRLVSQTGSYAPSILPESNPTAHQYDDNHRLLSGDSVAIEHDANGNITAEGARRYIWNARNELVRITEGGVEIASFTYDVQGRRTSRTESGTTVEYLYDGLNVVQEKRGAVVNPVLSGLGVDQRFARNAGGQRTYFLVDHLGSTRALTDASGRVVKRYDYDPYGNVAFLSDELENPYLFAGRERDASGLYYYRARYYKASMGRFISEDPIGLAGGLNPYAYVGGDPVSYVDPSGLLQVRAYASRAGGVGNEWRYVIEFNPFSLKDVPGIGGQLRRAGNRLEAVVNAMKPSAVGPQRPIKDALECGVLDSKLKKAYEDAGYRPGQHLTRQQAENFLNQARASHPEMRTLYDPATTMLDAAREKGRNNWFNSLYEQAHPGEF